MKLPLAIFIFLPLTLRCQIKKTEGISFYNELTWNQIKAKAKLENKYIFIDCFATWCAPCKQMDEEVFSDDSVAKIAASKFISLKLQFDTTSLDGLNVMERYAIAHKFQSKYNITSLPTYLFFSPDGIAVYKDIGTKTVSGFIQVLNKALENTYKKYFVTLDAYQNGKLAKKEIPFLINLAKRSNDNYMAQKIASLYIKDEIYRCDYKSILTRENLILIGTYLKSSKEKGFRMFYRNPLKVDAITGINGFSNNAIYKVIEKEDIIRPENLSDPYNDPPDWNAIKKKISIKYSLTIAERSIVIAQFNWYKTHYDSPRTPQRYRSDSMLKKISPAIHFEYINKYKLDTVIRPDVLGNMIELFIVPYSEDKTLLTNALAWIGTVMKTYPGGYYSYDYAILLYKLGYIQQAVAWQELTLKLLEYDALKAKRVNYRDDSFYKKQMTILEQMTRGEKL